MKSLLQYILILLAFSPGNIYAGGNRTRQRFVLHEG